MVAAAAPAHAAIERRGDAFGSLVADRKRVLDLPEGFSYSVVARAGEEMSDGLLVPALADGMAAFPGENNRINLVCNHENEAFERQNSPFGRDLERLDRIDKDYIYDFGGGRTPGNGGTTTIIYDPASRQKEDQFLSLAGTELNCAGGPTPWGSWLSCEETFSDPGAASASSWPYSAVLRDERHGYVFEVPAGAKGLAKPVALRDMGRFEHEAAAVDPASGVVFLTEDRHRSLFYRYIPNVPGSLHEGGKLQALAIASEEQFDTRNWIESDAMPANVWMDTRWVDIDDVDGDANDLRLRGYENGAARFARGEGLCYADGSVFFTCTIGGPQRLGQVFEYRMSASEGSGDERNEPGQLRLLAQAEHDSILRNADNLTMSPWGDLIICEDTADHCGLVGIRPDGSKYMLADNPYTTSELAGVCFAPDGKTLFVNIQEPGATLAIIGPF